MPSKVASASHSYRAQSGPGWPRRSRSGEEVCGRPEETATAPRRAHRCPSTLTPNVSSVLEVHQFAQEAVVADAWLTAQEPLLQSRELGSSVDEVEQLIRRHEAFRKAAAAWEERFSSLRRLTTVSPDPHTHIVYIRRKCWDLELRVVSRG